MADPVSENSLPLLSDEQRTILDSVVLERKSVFFTGSAGTGKSFLLRNIIFHLKERLRHNARRQLVAVTAPTGIAALAIEGVTIHSWAGLGQGDPVDAWFTSRWRRVQVLIIDEVSMLDAVMFDKLEAMARQLRMDERPFGGIQLIVTGDFFQLGPVGDRGSVEPRLAFEAASWRRCFHRTIALRHVFRQSDANLATMLDQVRLGRVSDATTDAFRALASPRTFEDGVTATELFPTRREVDEANRARLLGLPGAQWDFDATDVSTRLKPELSEQVLSSVCKAPARLTLREGAQVMLIKNIDETLVNGSVGLVQGFMSKGTFALYNSRGEGERSHEDVGVSGVAGAVDDRDDKVTRLWAPSRRPWPLVHFTTPSGARRDILCRPETWRVQCSKGEVLVSRTQVPLTLAWALSIHKAQGMTLYRVKVDLRKIFATGQAYVALSRATTLEGLQVIGFEPGKAMVNDKAVEFYSHLEDITTETEMRQEDDDGTGSGDEVQGRGGRGGRGGREGGRGGRGGREGGREGVRGEASRKGRHSNKRQTPRPGGTIEKYLVKLP